MLPAPTQRRALIDIGTNSVKLLVADVSSTSIVPVWEGSEQTRLGQGFYEGHILQPVPIARTADAVARFSRVAREHGAAEVQAVATSAARDAVNRRDLLDAVHAASGLRITVISGETEAEWSFSGVLSTEAFRGRRLLVLDVGGGSTEFIVGNGATIGFRRSFELGSVRAFEHLRPPESPSMDDLRRAREHLDGYLCANVLPVLATHLEPSPDIALGVGGSTAILAMIQLATDVFDREHIESTRFTAESLKALVERLWKMPVMERRQLPGLPPERADVILTGAAIYEAILRVLRPPALGISTRGLRFGALMA
jgi:exopolyphosphatase/guanosine-5'-triphosphate,3'-diphosphate pyrophosphatase